MSLLAMSVVLAATLPSPVQYHTTRGAVSLTELASPVALERGDVESLARLVGKTPGARLVELFAGHVLVEGLAQPAAFARAAVSSGAARRVLATYASDESGGLLVADGKVRAHFDARLSAAMVTERVKAAGGQSARLIVPAQSIYEIVVANAADTVAVADELQSSRAAVWAHPDFIYKKDVRWAPNDSYLSEQWHLDLIGVRGAWDVTQGSQNVTIAILDSGIDLGHPDLAAKIVSPRDTLEGDDDPSHDEGEAHGTACAGLAAAVTDNDLGVAGVCPKCMLMPVRIMNEEGYGRFGADSDAFRWAVDHGAQVLSNSWGPAGPASVPSDLDAAIQYAVNTSRGGKGAVVLFAAGNDDRVNQPQEVASHPLVIGVGASSAADRRETYSNFGPTLKVMAPAGAVTTDPRGGAGYMGGDYMSFFSGTSAATPVAAGLAGLLLSVNAELTWGQVQSILLTTADKIGSDPYNDRGFNDYYGFGRINALRATQTAAGGDVCQPIPENCANKVDDDCDFLIDDADPSCAPTSPLVGVPCTQDFQCGPDAFCFTNNVGFPGGYCSVGCTASCPNDGLCIDGGRYDYCLDTCDTIADCRSGYDCLDAGDGTGVCYPSCTVNGCSEAEVCNEQSGECEHYGPVGVGGPCEDDLVCAENGRCLSERWGLPGGMCTVGCSEEADCGDGAHCYALGRHFMACLPACYANSDCREGYACNPLDTGYTGVCWVGCTSSADCDGEYCNDYGLCGTLVPPDVQESIDNPLGACTCDVDTACSSGCDCDPECTGDGKKKDGCAAVAPGSWWMLLGVLPLLRRRKR